MVCPEEDKEEKKEEEALIKYAIIEISFEEGSKEPVVEIARFGFEDIKEAEKVRSDYLDYLTHLSPQMIQVLQYEQ